MLTSDKNGDNASVLGILEIQTVPSPYLSMLAQELSFPLEEDIRKMAEMMAKTMYATDGCGIAAPQIGLCKRLVVIDCQYMDSGERRPVFMVNPVIEETAGGMVDDYEGCLSVPGITLMVSRRAYARARFHDLDGIPHVIEGDGLLGRCLQHEMDHLDGKTMLDAVRGVRKMKAISLYQSALKQGAIPGSEPLFSVK